jgi:threonyl-tRNA synthetase
MDSTTNRWCFPPLIRVKFATFVAIQRFKMINITLPDGSVRQVEAGTSSMDIAKSISEGLARNVLAAKINGDVVDAFRPITTDSSLQLLTWNDQEG